MELRICFVSFIQVDVLFSKWFHGGVILYQYSAEHRIIQRIESSLMKRQLLVFTTIESVPLLFVVF